MKNKFSLIYFLLLLTLTIALAFKPGYNWDMLPYMAITEKIDGVKPFDKIHADVYSNAKKNLSSKRYHSLTDTANAYRKKMFEDADAFQTQLPFFNIKPLYLISVYIFYKLGAALTYATIIPSLIAFLCMNVLAYFWCRRFRLSFPALIIALMLVCVITIPFATRSNPDGLAFLFAFAGAFFFLETENLFIAVVFLVLSILTRPDYIIFALLLYSIVLMAKWKRKVPFFISSSYLLLLLLSYYLPLKIMSNPGWSTLFFHAFINNTANPAAKQTVTIPLYLKVINHNILTAKGIAAFAFLVLLSLPVLWFKRIQSKESALYKLFFIVVAVWAITKFLLFPMGSLRFLIPPFLLMLFVEIKEYELTQSKKLI
jgi:hypothetical protein